MCRFATFLNILINLNSYSRTSNATLIPSSTRRGAGKKALGHKLITAGTGGQTHAPTGDKPSFQWVRSFPTDPGLQAAKCSNWVHCLSYYFPGPPAAALHAGQWPRLHREGEEVGRCQVSEERKAG